MRGDPLQEHFAAENQGDRGESEHIEHIGAHHVAHGEAGVGRVHQPHRGDVGGQLGQRGRQGDQDAADKQPPPSGQRGQGVAVDRQADAEKDYRGGAAQKYQQGNPQLRKFNHPFCIPFAFS